MLFFTFTDQWRMLAVDEVVLVYRTDIGLGICHLFGSDGSVGTAYVDVLRNNCAPLVLD